MEGQRASEYRDPMSAAMLGMAADVLRSFGGAAGGRHVALVGGVVPGVMVGEVPPGMEPHVGTSDLDLSVTLHLLDGETAEYYGAILDGLRSLGLSEDKADGRERRWRWVGTHRQLQLQVELLCPSRTRPARPEPPTEGSPAEKNIGPKGEITALAMGYCHLVQEDTIFIERTVQTSEGRLEYPFPVAGVASWLCLKADAITHRNKPKDAYDVVWLLAGLGPKEAAERCAESPLLRGEHADETIAQLTRLQTQFADEACVGPQSYAEFLGSDDLQDSQFAIGAVGAFGTALDGLIGGGS